MSAITLSAFETDEHVARRVMNSLQGLGYPQLASVKCEAKDSTVVLKGELGTFFLSQIAQTIAARVPGVRHVVNKLSVETGS